MKVAEATLANPCGADWRTMRSQGERARLCAECSTIVHDLSSMSEAQARALLQRPRNERLCVRYLHDELGNVWFGEKGPEPLVAAGRLVRGRVAAWAGATALLVAPVLLEACGGANPYDGLAGDGGSAPAQLVPASPAVGSGDGGARTDAASQEATAAEPDASGTGTGDSGSD